MATPRANGWRRRRSNSWPARGVVVSSSAPRLRTPGSSTRAIILALRLRCDGLYTTCYHLVRLPRALCEFFAHTDLTFVGNNIKAVDLNGIESTFAHASGSPLPQQCEKKRDQTVKYSYFDIKFQDLSSLACRRWPAAHSPRPAAQL